jgi:hypothetical protein
MTEYYNLINIDELYFLEITNPNHRPSSLNDTFSKDYNNYIKFNTTQFKNDYFFDFINNNYNNYNKKVIYLTNEELLNYKCNINNNNIKSSFLDTKIINNYQDFIYIMNPNGDFYIIEKKKDNENQINHTSLSQGNRVSSAGWIRLDSNKNIINLANISGHFKPSDLSIHNALHCLKYKYNCNLNLIELDIYKIIHNAEIFFNNLDKIDYKMPLLDYIKYTVTKNLYHYQIKGDYLISGSTIYNNKIGNDVDSIFLFRTRKELEDFIDRDLYNFFNLDVNDEDKFTKEELKYFINEKIEILRITGFIKNIKITIKLFSLENYDINNECFCRVYIKNKNKRIYERVSLYDNNKIHVLLQNKTVSENVYVILDKNFYNTGNSISLGLITDMLLTSKHEYSLGGYWYKFKELLEKKILELFILEKSKLNFNNFDNIIKHLVRYDRFENNTDYINNFNNNINLIANKYKQSFSYNPKYLFVTDNSLWNINKNLLFFNKNININFKRTHNNYNLIEYFTNIEELKNVSIKNITTNYSSNSNIGYILDNNEIKFFYKLKRNEFESVYHEYNGYHKLKLFYNDLIEEAKTDNNFNFIYYNYINHDVFMDYFLDIDKYFFRIVDIQLQQNELLLNGFLNSITTNTTINENIHKLFYLRLFDRWFSWDYDNIFNKNIIINDIEYNKIDLDDIKKILNPKYLDKLIKVYSFGDNHAGNIIIEKNTNKCYNIDYEYASIAHPCLHMAKNIFNDIYSDILYDNYDDIIYDKSDNIIKHNYILSEEKKILLEIKIKGVIEEFLLTCIKNNIDKELLKDFDKVLKYSLFCCCVLTKKIDINNPKSIMKLALGYEIISDIVNDNNSNNELYINKIIQDIKYKLTI